MLTDRPDVHVHLWALETPKWVLGGQTQERAYNSNDNVSRGF